MTSTQRMLKASQAFESALRIAPAVAVLLVLGACAASPQLPPHAPAKALEAAELAVARAEQAQVAYYALSELSAARESLNAAYAAVHRKQMILAQSFAVQARVGAELASAKAAAANARSIHLQMQASFDNLTRAHTPGYDFATDQPQNRRVVTANPAAPLP